MTLVVTLNTSAAWQRLVSKQSIAVASTLLDVKPDSATNATVIVASETSAEQLASLVKTQQTVVLVYQQAEYAIAYAINQGQTPAAALAAYCQQAKQLLSLKTQHRKNIVLLNMQQLTAQAITDQHALLNNFALAELKAVETEFNPVALLIACQLCTQQPEVQALKLQLQVSSLPLAEAEQLMLPLDSIWQNFVVEEKNGQAKLAQLQHNLQQNVNAEKQTAKQISTLEKQLAEVGAELAQANAKQNELTGENELVLMQLMQVQEELERYYLSHKAAEQQLEKHKTELTKVKADLKKANAKRLEFFEARNAKKAALNDLGKQFSEQQQQFLISKEQLSKLTEQLAHVNNTAKSQSEAITKSETENNLLNQTISRLRAESASMAAAAAKIKTELEQDFNAAMQQLSQAQQQCVAQLSVNEQLTAQLAQLQQEKQSQQSLNTQKTKQQQREITKLEAQLKNVKDEVAALKYQNLQLSNQLEQIRSSASWKIAAPVRVISRAIKKNDAEKNRLLQDVGLLFTSEYFDAEWYLATYPDVKDAELNPAEHYLKHGAAEGRRPSADFDGEWYLQRYPDVAKTGVNPLLHYIKFGRNEGRTASPKLLEDHSEVKQG